MNAGSQFIYRVCYVLAGIVRILSLLVIVRWPLVGWFIVFFIDTIDYFFALRGGLTYLQYQLVDKSLDILNRLYFVAPAFILDWPVKHLFLAFFVYRLIGDILYFKNKAEKYFFLFPNILEFLLPTYIIFNHNLLLSLVVSIPLKLVHEYGLHIKNLIDPISRSYILQHPEHNRETANKKLS